MSAPLYDEVVSAQPHSFGWLRVSDFDEMVSSQSVYYEAWERPDGVIVKMPRRDPAVALDGGSFLFVRHRGQPAICVWPQGVRQWCSI